MALSILIIKGGLKQFCMSILTDLSSSEVKDILGDEKIYYSRL